MKINDVYVPSQSQNPNSHEQSLKQVGLSSLFHDWLLEVIIQTIDELVDTDFVPKVGLVSIPMPLGRDEHPVDDLNHAVLSDDILH
jgi:hypothetical protein